MSLEPPQRMVEWSNARVVVPLVALQSLIYMILNRRAMDGSSATPATSLDVAVGFQSWTVWAYVALIATPVVMALMIRNRDIFRLAIVAYLIAMSATFTVFLVWPTHCPRPTPPMDASWNSWAYRALIAMDGPGCAFPSGHIIVPTILCWAIWRDRHPYRMGALLWLILSAPSILTTKQHHAWDLLGGLVVAGFGILVAQFWSFLRPTSPSNIRGDGL